MSQPGGRMRRTSMSYRTDPHYDDVTSAREGDREALERLVRSVGPAIGRLALRFFGCPSHAEDASQEALVQIVTKLDRFDRESAFATWAYRVAVNKFLSLKRSPVEKAARSFEELDDDLATDTGPLAARAPDVDRELLLAEVRIGCTLAMLACLERASRMAYILGEIVELDHADASYVLGCSPAAYRQRLARARARVTDLMRRRCGVFDGANLCQCEARIPVATARGYVNPRSLVYATSPDAARAFPDVEAHIRRLEEAQRAAAIYQSHPEPRSRADLAARLLAILGPVA